MMKFKVGDYVMVVDTNDYWKHAIGQVARVVSDEHGYILEFIKPVAKVTKEGNGSAWTDWELRKLTPEEEKNVWLYAI